MVLDLLSSSICYLGSGVGQGPARDGDGLWVFFRAWGRLETDQEVGVYGGLGPL